MKILWSVDAFDDLEDLHKQTVSLLKQIASRAPSNEEFVVDPVYVLSPEQLGVPMEFSGPWTEMYGPAAEKALEQRLRGVDVPGLGKGRVLIHHRASLRGTVEAISSFAAAGKYDFLVAGTHGRRGFARMMLGSFAEELLLQSRIPLLVVGTGAGKESYRPATGGGIQNILLPSDLAHPHSPFFTKAFDLAARLKARATLLNVVPRPIEPVFQSGVYLLTGGWVPVPTFLERERLRQSDAAKLVLGRAKEAGVTCELVQDDASPSVVESILRHAKEGNVDLIAMAAESGPVASALLGSIARQVVRLAPCPVWVFRNPGSAR